MDGRFHDGFRPLCIRPKSLRDVSEIRTFPDCRFRLISEVSQRCFLNEIQFCASLKPCPVEVLADLTSVLSDMGHPNQAEPFDGLTFLRIPSVGPLFEHRLTV